MSEHYSGVILYCEQNGNSVKVVDTNKRTVLNVTGELMGHTSNTVTIRSWGSDHCDILDLKGKFVGHRTIARPRNEANHVSEYQQRPQTSAGGSPPFNETQKLIQKSITAIAICFGIYKSFPHPEGADVIANIIIYGIAGFLAGTFCAMFYILGAIIIVIVGGFYIYYRGWMFFDPKGLDKHMKEIDAKRMVAEQSAPQEKNERSSPFAAAPPPKVRAVEKNETHEPLQQLNPKPSNSATMPAVSTKYYSQPAQNVPQSSVGNAQVLDNRSSTPSTDYSRVDAQLNVAYRTAMGRLDQQGQERLRVEQRNWIKQRDAAASRNPIEAEPIKLKMTILRTRELELYR